LPFTPYHFGPGLLIKAAAPGRFSFTAYAATQVFIDVESGFFLFTNQTPVHRTLHTFLVSGAAGLAVGLASSVIGGRFLQRKAELGGSAMRTEFLLWPCLWGGIVGGLLHSLLDGIMHADIHPLRPFSDANPLHGIIGLSALHLGCLVCGFVGVIWLGQTHYRETTV
jgi:hypothetical protein